MELFLHRGIILLLSDLKGGKCRFCAFKEYEMLESCKYVVEQIDGDYAHLRKIGEEDAELKLVARALLPAEIREGSVLNYEFLQYSLAEE
jgi:hypothetical protein